MSTTSALVIVGNGPGEVAGWALPVARAARELARREQHAVEISLCLPPCQFASGQERQAAETAAVFDHIIDPAMTLRLGLGFAGWAPIVQPALLHVGGDFWYTRRLARRWRARAFAFVERAHIARAHRAFTSIFVATERLRERLEQYGVPRDKVAVTGDPRHDAVFQQHRVVAAAGGNGRAPRVTLLAGSRDTVFNAVFPFWVETGVALRRRLPDAALTIVVSPFVSPAIHEAVVAHHGHELSNAGITVARGSAADVAGSDLVLTIPGTNTLELAIMRVPSIVVMPFSLAPRIPFEGIIEWITRAPFIGPALRLFLAREYVKRQPHGVSLPNMRAGRRIMPEMVGQITAEEVADEGARIVSDKRTMASMAEALEAIPVETGASERILRAMGWAWNAA